MPPPPNTTSATAIVIPSLEGLPSFTYTNVQTGIHDAGTTYDVWYKYTPVESDGLIGLLFYGDPTTYKPSTSIYIDNDFTFLYNSFNLTPNRMLQIPTLTGRVYFFKILTNAGNPTPATLNVSVKRAQDNINAPSSIFIRPASILQEFIDAGYSGLAGGFINPTTGVITRFVEQVVPGEPGDYLPVTGEILFPDEYINFNWHLFNADISLKTTFTYAWSGGHPQVRTHREQSRFLIVNQNSPNPIKFRFCDSNGNLTPETTVTVGNTGCTAAACSAAGDFIYMAGVNSSLNSNIKKWDVVGGVFVADLAATVANHICRDMLVMSNGDIVAIYHRASTDEIFVRVYNTAGATLRTWTAPVGPNYTTVPPRLGYGNDSSVTFWVFLHINTGFSHFFHLRVADVTEVVNFQTPDAIYATFDQGGSPTYRFVTSDSCPLVLSLASFAGLYVTDPTHVDQYQTVTKKIPNPTFKTALIGE
jgi:hypothetical protein